MNEDVVIVGAGPVGLMLATELVLAGVLPIVIERLATPSPQRKSRGVDPLAMEALMRRGLGDRLADSEPERAAEKERDHGSAKNHFAWIHKIDPALQDEPGRRGALIWQPDLEAILTEYAEKLGVTVLREHTATALAQDSDGVNLTVDTPEGTREVRASFVVGCDGGRSFIRKAAGFDFPGTAPIMTARQAQVAIENPEALPDSGRLPGGMLLHGPGVIGTFDFSPEHDSASGPVTPEEMSASVRRVAGVDVTITAVTDALRFTDNARQATAYQRGRVLLAGDAAHVHSPNGGQGLNLGLMDAVNLGWKLASAVRASAPAGLLDSYTKERHPAGEAVLRNTRAQSALMLPGPHTDALRDIVSDLMDIREVNSYFSRLLGGLDTRYELPYATAETHPLTGRLCPNLTITLEDREAELTEFTASGQPVLLIPADAHHEVHGCGGTAVVEVAGIAHPELSAVLVRPDGVIAWACAPGDPLDLDLLRTALDTWFGRSAPATV